MELFDLQMSESFQHPLLNITNQQINFVGSFIFFILRVFYRADANYNSFGKTDFQWFLSSVNGKF